MKLSEPAWKGRSVTPKNSFTHLISLLHRFGRMRILSSAASPPKFSKPELKDGDQLRHLLDLSRRASPF